MADKRKLDDLKTGEYSYSGDYLRYQPISPRPLSNTQGYNIYSEQFGIPWGWPLTREEKQQLDEQLKGGSGMGNLPPRS